MVLVLLSVLVGVGAGAGVGFVGHGRDGGIVDGGIVDGGFAVLGADVFLIFSFSSSFEKTSKWLLLSSSSSSMGLGS